MTDSANMESHTGTFMIKLQLGFLPVVSLRLPCQLTQGWMSLDYEPLRVYADESRILPLTSKENRRVKWVGCEGSENINIY